MFHIPEARAWMSGIAVVAMLALAGCNEAYDTTLGNGLRVIVKEDRRSPVVVSMVWYKVGSMDEPKGLTGMSHVLEHMMFKGTERLEPNEFSRIIAEHGGRENAFTSYDYTGYFQQLEKSRLPIALELEADRMQNLKLDEAEFRKEVQVVMEERRLRTDDRPEALVYEKFMSEAYQVHAYHHPIIGWMDDLERIRLDDLREWYRRWYRPDNAVLVVAGDVDSDEVVALVKKYFDGIPARRLKRPPIPAEPPQTKERRAVVRAPAEVPYLLMGYHVPVHSPASPEGESSEPYALSILAGVLSGGQSARLERELVREQRVAASVGAHYDSIGRAPTLMLFSGTPTAAHDVAGLERALRSQIDRLKKEPVSEAELARVKAQVVAGDVFRRDSVFYQAMELGQLAIAGLDLSLLDRRVERLQAVTAEQVMQVARKYLNDPNLTVVTLDPLPLSEGARKKPPVPEGGRYAH